MNQAIGATQSVMTSYDREDLLDAYLAARRWSNAHDDLRTYYGNRYEALAAAFSVDLDHPLKTTEASWLNGLFVVTREKYDLLTSPFAGYLEAPPPIIGLYSVHGERVRSDFDAVRASCFRLLVDIASEVWGLPADRMVTIEDAQRYGFDPTQAAPDPDDYW
jgi:hypothetical protein